MVRVLYAETKTFKDKTNKDVEFQELGLFDEENKRMGKAKNYDLNNKIDAGDVVELVGYIKYDGSLAVTVRKI